MAMKGFNHFVCTRTDYICCVGFLWKRKILTKRTHLRTLKTRTLESKTFLKSLIQRKRKQAEQVRKNPYDGGHGSIQGKSGCRLRSTTLSMDQIQIMIVGVVKLNKMYPTILQLYLLQCKLTGKSLFGPLSTTCCCNYTILATTYNWVQSLALILVAWYRP